MVCQMVITQKSITIYLDEYLSVVAYTRNIKDQYGGSDIISLVGFIKPRKATSINLKWLCDAVGIDYYGKFDDEIP